MMGRDFETAFKLFHISNQLIENSLDIVENRLGLSLGRDYIPTIQSDADYYPQIDAEIRLEANKMAEAYEIFYSLEKTIRMFIEDSFDAAGIVEWWDEKYVPVNVKNEAEKRMEKEIDSGITPRSDDPIDYTNFGELNEIIKANWEIFGGMLRSKKAVSTVLTRLNTLRAPIAHCSLLAEDEMIRLQLSVRDWFRLMS